MPNGRTLAAAAVAATVLLVGCGSGGTAPAGGQPTVPGAPVGTAASMLDFTGTTLAGSSFDGASLQGRPAVIWFWAPF